MPLPRGTCGIQSDKYESGGPGVPIVTWRCQQRGPSQEDGLGDLGLGARGRAPELVKVDVEPFVNGLVDRVVLVANLLLRQALLQSLRGQSGETGIDSTFAASTARHVCVISESQ